MMAYLVGCVQASWLIFYGLNIQLLDRHLEGHKKERINQATFHEVRAV